MNKKLGTFFITHVLRISMTELTFRNCQIKMYLDGIAVGVEEEEQEDAAEVVRVRVRVTQLVCDPIEQQIAAWK